MREPGREWPTWPRLLHYQVQSASLRVVHLFSIYEEFLLISLRRNTKYGFASMFALAAAMGHEFVWRLSNTLL